MLSSAEMILLLDVPLKKGLRFFASAFKAVNFGEGPFLSPTNINIMNDIFDHNYFFFKERDYRLCRLRLTPAD